MSSANSFRTSELLKSISNYPVSKGDVDGHEFHGNQWTGGQGGGENLPPSPTSREVDLRYGDLIKTNTADGFRRNAGSTGMDFSDARDFYRSDEGNGQINDALRSGETLTPEAAKAVDALDKEVADSLTTGDETVWRGLTLPEGTNLEPGTKLTDAGFQSTTTSFATAKDFADLRGGGESGLDASQSTRTFGGEPHVLEIHVEQGQPLLGMGTVASMKAEEYILPRGTTYEVLGTRLADDPNNPGAIVVRVVK